MTGALAFAAAALGVCAAADLALPRVSGGGLPGRLAARAAAAADAVARAGREGREPGTAERRRLLAAGAAALFAGGALVAGPLPGAVLACAAPWLLARALRARRERWRRAVERGAGALCRAVADALAGGRSLRGALSAAGGALPGPAGRELRRVGVELALGARTDDALERLRLRVRSPAFDAVIAAALLQARAGGDLAALLRASARAFDEEARLADAARAATAQARFTALVVVLLPLGGAGLAELAAPGFLIGLASSFLTAWLVGVAIVLQLAAAVAIRRLGRVRE